MFETHNVFHTEENLVQSHQDKSTWLKTAPYIGQHSTSHSTVGVNL